MIDLRRLVGWLHKLEMDLVGIWVLLIGAGISAKSKFTLGTIALILIALVLLSADIYAIEMAKRKTIAKAKQENEKKE